MRVSNSSVIRHLVLPEKYAQAAYHSVANDVLKYSIILSENLSLFDRSYYVRVSSVGGGNYYGTPRNAMLTVRGAF
mgnify:CR=1 FL=1